MDLSLIRNITSATNMSQLEKTLKFVGPVDKTVSLSNLDPLIDLKRKILAEDETPEPTDANPEGKDAETLKLEKNPKVDFDIDYVIMLRAENDRLSTLLNLYQDKIDQDLPNLKIEIDLSIYDYSTAYEATVFYSKDWFANSLLSDDGKVEFATYLLGAIKTYCSANTETLKMIAAGDSEILAYIRIPRQDNS
jgi:hypothetical protein